MRRFDEAQENKFNKSVKLGEENAECLRQMQLWCKNVVIELVSAGLYAEITGLPIGSHSIGCPHIEGGFQSMNLPWIFSDFLVQKCADCQHHTPNGNSTWGQEIIDNYRKEAHQREQAAKEEEDRISRLRADLRSKSKQIKSESEPESQRILEYIEAIFSEDEAKRIAASERLKQSAHLGPELFPDEVIDLVLALAVSSEFSELILPACAELAVKRAELGTRFTQTSLSNIENGLQPELSALILDWLGKTVAYPLEAKHIEQLLLFQYHDIPFGTMVYEEPAYSHSTTILVRCFDAEPESVQSLIRRELQNAKNDVRAHLCGALKLINSERPQISVNLLSDLIRSLDLKEEEHLGTITPSGQIIKIMQSTFRYSPALVDQKLADSMKRVRPAVQEDIINVYRDQFFHHTGSWEEREEHRNRSEVTEPEKTAINRLLDWIKDDRLEVDIRTNALEALEMACNYASAGVVKQFDSLLGYFALISADNNPPETPPKILLLDQKADPQLEQMNEFNRTQQWSTFKQRLQNCLEELCEAKSTEVLESVHGCLTHQADNIAEDFKACCVSLLGKLGRDYLLRPSVLPLIWRSLMDYESPWVRSKAIYATIEMFSYSSASPPSNLVDIIILHLQDPIIAVHKAALQAVSRKPRWFNESQSIEALNCLAKHIQAYRTDKYQLDDICDGIMAVSRKDERLKVFALRMIEPIFPTGETLVDAKIAEGFMHFCRPEERIATHVAKNIGIYLGRHGRDRMNAYEYSRRGAMFAWLHKLPIATFQVVVENLLIASKDLAKRDAWESCHFASMFAHFRAFRYEQDVLETAADSLPVEPRNEKFRTSLQQLAIVAKGNALLMSGDTKAAEACFIVKRIDD